MATCSKCEKRLTRKTARWIEGRVICSACLFPKLKGGLPDLGHRISTAD